MRQIIKDLGGKNWRRGCEQPPTDLILAHATTDKQKHKIKNEVSQFEKIGAEFETHTLDWLFELRDTENGEKHNESLSSTGRTESSIRIPSRQIVPVTPRLADRTTERAREGHENLFSMRADPAISTIIPDTLPSNIQDKVTTAIVEPMYTRQCAPVGAHNRVVEGPRVLCTDKTSPSPPKRAGEVDVKFIPVPRYVDEYGNYIVVPNTKLTEMFEVVKSLGKVAYGRVVQARRVVEGRDTVSDDFVAIKISALGKECSDAARNELRILETLKMHDEKNQNQCIHAQMCFEYRGHICMVMDLLGQSTYEFLKKNKYVPYPDNQIQSFARQLFNSVASMIEAIAGLKIEEEIAWITDAKFRGILSALLPNAMQEPRKKVEKMKMKHLDQIIPGNNAFLKSFADLLKSIFVLNPNHRITAKQALQHPCLVEEAQPDDGTVAAEIH
ncbi:hypothetical protein H9L39_17662 [Fusarium oxysporum f. sp. albedinis]|nr:hypothetical protein H9L39_17662 [Fusarium oxysporum f. sp. albedinis]